MKIKLYSFFAFFYLILTTTSAQPGLTLPYWVKNPPKDSISKHYYYRVTMAEEPTYEKAYANAFAKAAMEAKWRLGVRINFSDDIQALENSVTEGVNVSEKSINIPINKVCDYWEVEHSMKGDYVRLYVLWQVAKYGNQDPNFEEYTKCQ